MCVVCWWTAPVPSTADTIDRANDEIPSLHPITYPTSVDTRGPWILPGCTGQQRHEQQAGAQVLARPEARDVTCHSVACCIYVDV